MSKNKNILEKSAEKATEVAGTIGIYLMAAAALSGLVAPGHEDKRVVLPGQAVTFATEDNSQENNPIRREKDAEEESGPHYISYSVIQRTPSRSGKI